MWIMTPTSFLSVVHKDCAPDELLVRSRMKGHIEAVFPDAMVTESTHTDYRYRAVLPRTVVAQAMCDQVTNLQYDNYKNSVKNHAFHDALAAVWSIMARLQPTRPYSGAAAARGRLF